MTPSDISPPAAAETVDAVGSVGAERGERDAGRSSEDNFRRIVDGIPGLIFTYDAQGRTEFVSRQLLEYFGRTFEQLRDWEGTDVIHPDDVERVTRAWRQNIEAGTAHSYEERLRGADGMYRWFLLRCTPAFADGERDSDRRVVRWYGLVTDIDDLKRAQEEARRSERHLRLMLDTIPGSVFTLTPDGELEQVNQHTLEYFGKTLDELRDWRTVTHPDDVGPVWDSLKHALATGEPWQSSSRGFRADGTYRWFQTRGLPLRDIDGRIVRWYCVNVDIHDLKLAQEESRLNESQLRLILDNIPGYVFTLTPSGELEQVNRQILEYCGAPFEELRDWARVTHPDDVERARSRLAEAISTGTPWLNEARALRADGVYRWFQTRGLPLRDADGRILRWYCLLIDIDDLKRAEETSRSVQAKLARASQLAAVSELAASIAHELNQPLAAVIANGHACRQWIAGEPPNVERALTSAERTIRDATSAAELLSRIRALFRHAAPAKRLLDLNEVIGEVARLIADDVESRGVVLRLELQPDLPLAAADRVQVQQVVVNLARNGIDAMDGVNSRAKELVIATAARDGEIVVEVRDVGTGLDGSKSLFEPFVTTKASGMGMGLAICKSILDAHGGRLWAGHNSTCGAIFAFSLPTT